MSAEPVSAEPAAASPESAFGAWAVPSEADRGLWLRVLPAAVRAAPASAGAEFVAKGEVGRMLEEQRSGTAGLTRTVVVLIGGLLALAAVVGTVVLPRLRRGAAPEA
ncbi:MAG: hypothetical protein EPO52_07565 [Herbiconiux sp.]|uniref:hypothetical protein n=1 Tax=Herbiconiux sp. TaxID=1871186 RepID=UPI00122465F7|nr:hypothetical protein [Herbiconiux sp.]TAJ48028.1 MAG: hypothetical protein EPO52_07565 [Herbiconiux sp.]